jgi:hypothetical protein
MPLPIQVTAYSGYKPNERPCTLLVDEDLFDMAGVLSSWRDPNFDYFKVLTVDGKTFLLRCEFETQEWELCSEYDGAELMSRPSIELIAVDAETIHKAEKLMESCEQCHPDDTDIPFDWLLAEVTGKHGKYDFVMAELARCPTCKRFVSERTFVERKEDKDA